MTTISATQSIARSDTESKNSMRMLTPFLLITFGLTWGLGFTFLLFNDQVVALFGEVSMSNPLFILAVYAPGIAGVTVVWRKFGLGGLGSLFRRLTLWRMSAWWWLFLILGVPAFMYLGAAVNGTLGEPFPFSPWVQAIPALALALVLGPIEEIGWRGVALPLLQRRFAPFWAGLILGAIWMVWHGPAFLIGGTPQSAWSFLPYFTGGVAMSVVFTALFNDSRGSLLLAALLHFQLNNPIWPDAQPWDNLFIIAIAVMVVWLKRDTMFQKGSGVTDILMPEKHA